MWNVSNHGVCYLFSRVANSVILIIVCSWFWHTASSWLRQVPDNGVIFYIMFLIRMFLIITCSWLQCVWLAHVPHYGVFLITVRSWLQSVPDYSLLRITAYSWLWIMMCSCLQHATDNWVFLVMFAPGYCKFVIMTCSSLRRVRAYIVFLLIVCSWVWHVCILFLCSWLQCISHYGVFLIGGWFD